MRTFELRVYTLRTRETLDFYASTVIRTTSITSDGFGDEAHG